MGFGGSSGAEKECGVAMVGRDHRFVWADDAFCKMLGYTAAELIGREFEEITHPDDRSIGTHLAERFIAGEIAAVEFDKRYIAKDGSIVPVHISSTWVTDAQKRGLYGVAVIYIRNDGEAPPLAKIEPSESAIERIRKAMFG